VRQEAVVIRQNLPVSPISNLLGDRSLHADPGFCPFHLNAYNHELPSSISFRDAFPRFGVGVLRPPDKFKGVGFLHAAVVLVHIDLFGNHDLPSPILAWICSFLTGRTLATWVKSLVPDLSTEVLCMDLVWGLLCTS